MKKLLLALVFACPLIQLYPAAAPAPMRGFPCVQCGRVCLSNAALTAHKRIHTGEKPFVCDQCGKSFAFKGNLTAHKKSCGTVKSYVCDVCNRVFRGMRDLFLHRKNDHTNPLVCIGVSSIDMPQAAAVTTPDLLIPNVEMPQAAVVVTPAPLLKAAPVLAEDVFKGEKELGAFLKEMK